MTYHTIMVSMDLSPSADNRVKLAGSIADRFEASLIGVAARPCDLPIVYGDVVPPDPTLVENEKLRLREDFAQVESQFRRAAGNRNSIKWRSGAALPAAFLAEQARAGDLIVVSRQGRGDPSDLRFGVSPADALVSIGRPILIVPPKVDHLSGRRVLVAWKDTREARRAVWDALPLLSSAVDVFILAVREEAPLDAADDVAEYLARHGIESATTLRSVANGNVAHEILRTADREGADLIISGGYGHSRMREWIFGGVTRDLLESAPVCCLMSH